MKNIDTNLPKFFGHVPILTAYKCSIPPIRKCNNNLKKKYINDWRVKKWLGYSKEMSLPWAEKWTIIASFDTIYPRVLSKKIAISQRSLFVLVCSRKTYISWFLDVKKVKRRCVSNKSDAKKNRKRKKNLRVVF